MELALDPGTYTGTYEADAGALCLDFTNTVSWRKDERRHDWLASYTNLVAWGLIAGVLNDSEARKLADRAGQQPEAAARVLARAMILREALYCIFSDASAGRMPDTAKLALLNDELRQACRYLNLAPAAGCFVWEWERDPDLLDRMLWPVAHSAAELLTSAELNRVGECEGEGCGWLFVDRSKNRSRRWCDMDGCGNRAKARQHYRRKRETQPEG
jgi:predicted RNA-binding Zn ribbon-like protein